MLWGISSFAALFLHSAARTLPRRDLGDLLPVGPELDDSDDSEPTIPVKIQTPQSSHTEQASTLFRIENSHVEIGTSALLQPTPAAHNTAQLTTTVLTGLSSHLHLTPTQTSTSLSPTPVLEGGGTHTSITATNASQNTANPTRYPSPLPRPPVNSGSGVAQGHAADWRMIGIAVIAVSAVGTMILIVVFFDQWWGFLRDVCGRRRKWHRAGKEELVPDWGRASWEFKIEEDTLPAYPSFGSPLAIKVEGVSTRVQPRKVDLARGPDHLESPPSWAPKENGQALGTQGVPCGPSRQNVMQFSPSGPVNEVTTYKCHSPLSRSNTEKSTASEDAYDGLAAW